MWFDVAANERGGERLRTNHKTLLLHTPFGQVIPLPTYCGLFHDLIFVLFFQNKAFTLTKGSILFRDSRNTTGAFYSTKCFEKNRVRNIEIRKSESGYTLQSLRSGS